MNESQKAVERRLETALIEYIENTVKKTSPDPAELSVVPAMAEALIKLWRT